MATVMVYSKNPNDVQFSQFNHLKNKDGEVVESRAFNHVVIQGLNKYLHANGMKMIHAHKLAKTEVDKDIWDAIYNERKDADMLLRSKQIFTAKNDAEAHAMLKDVERSVSDLYTADDLEKPRNKIAKLI